MARLLMISPAPVLRRETGLVLDAKFISGMQLHQEYWPGEIGCILREGADHIPFGATGNPSEFAFELLVLEAHEPISEDMLHGYDLVMCDADDANVLDVPEMCSRLGIKVVLVIEYTLETRLQIIKLDQSKSLPRRAYSMFWNWRQERRRMRAFKQADGVQANGYPAFDLYRPLNDNTMLYLDNRMAPTLFATDAEVADRAAYLRSGSPLRLIYSGRLETMKGVQDLVPISALLRDRGIQFTLDIFGSGSQKESIEAAIVAEHLVGVVILHEPVDFETELVPRSRKNADIYLCCHRQSDPSCTYLENMGCGLAVVGYGNRMWSSLSQSSVAGWVAPLGQHDQIAQAITQIDQNREYIVARCQNAIDFAKAHDYHSEFRARMIHLQEVVQDLDA